MHHAACSVSHGIREDPPGRGQEFEWNTANVEPPSSRRFEIDMSSAAVQKQQVGFLILLTGVTFIAARMLSGASTEHTLTFVLGTIACILAFLNAEIAMYFLILAMLLSPELD